MSDRSVLREELHFAKTMLEFHAAKRFEPDWWWWAYHRGQEEYWRGKVADYERRRREGAQAPE